MTPSDYTVHPATVAEPWDLTVAAHDGLPRTEMRRIFFAKRDLGDEVVAVFLTPGTTGQYVYEDDGTAVPAGNTVYAAQSGAFSYSQITASRPVRTGRRNVIVQFFSGTAAAAKTEFETTIPNSTVPSDEETSFLTANLTNSYVFTTNIPPKATDISLTSSFQANNGDNGLVDSGNLTLIAKNLPARWGSVKFEAYEENYGFGKPSIVFSKIVNLTDVQRAGLTGTPTFGEVVAQNQPAPSAVSAAGKDTYNGTTDTQDLTAPGGFPFANRQRVLRIYATCYELPDASGAVLAETRENGTTYNDPAGNFPVQFITTPRAEADVFFPNPGTHNEAAAALANMQLVRSISRVTATVPAIAKGGSQTITVTGLSHTDPRYGYNAVPPGGPSDLTRTLSNAGFVFAIDTVDSLAPFTILPNVLAAPSLPTATSPGGTLTWLGTSTVEFSQNTYTNPAALIQFRPYYPDANNPPYFAAPLLPTQGSGGGVIRGGIR